MATLPLNDRQRIFADSLLSGMAGADALVEAGYKVNGGESAAVGAARMKKRPAVAEYLAECRAESTSDTVLSLQRAKAILSAQAEDASLAPRDRRQAIETLARMGGWYAAEKREYDVSDPLLEVMKAVRR
jgi:phage terminase small subunit